MPVSQSYQPEPVYPDVGEGFFDAVEAARFPKYVLRYRNDRWAAPVGLDDLTNDEWLLHFGHFKPLPENIQQPLAIRYHGHQFQVYNPQIGDGRGFLFAQLRDSEDGRLLDLGTKGSGQTPYSRTADGRLTLKGGMREVLITALLEALGVYTSKTFSLIETGEELWRSDEPSPTRSSVLVRLNHSHIRFGTFQRHAFEGSEKRLRILLNHCIEYYFPHLEGLKGEARVVGFLRHVSDRAAALTASWMAAGFVHGVMNTDNMNVTGESFDYGPYRMLLHYDPNFTAAYFDETGLYAYGRQPEIMFWNLKQLAGALSLICSKDALVAALKTYPDTYGRKLRDKVFVRLGLQPQEFYSDMKFINDTFMFLQNTKIGFEQFFFDWYGGVESRRRTQESPVADTYTSKDFISVKERLLRYIPSAPDRLDHTYFQGKHPCTLIIDEVEALWDRIANNDDWSAFDSKLNHIECMRQALQGPKI